MDDSLPATRRCASCNAVVPELEYCVRCGAELVSDAHRRRRYAAAPDERELAPRIISTLFPKLPRASMGAFRLALLLAVALVVALALWGAFPLAIVVAAVAVPALAVIYLYDVDVYEDEPVIVIGLTVLWGAAMGVLVAMVGRVFAPSSADLLAQSTGETVLRQGLILPIVGLALALGGPLVLLPYRRFNDVLDGATFGAASAVWLVATQLLTQSASLFDEGLRPGTATETWILRLLQLAVAVPLLWAGVGGAVAGAFWLRYRSPVLHRSHGLVGRPFLSLGLACALVITAAVAQIVLVLWGALLVSFAFAAVGLLWLRHLVHIGLVSEAGERAMGEEIVCANCGEPTPTHTFCGSCGIALRALPKGRETKTHPFRSGAEPSRLRNSLVLGWFGAALVAAGGAALALVVALTPEVERTCVPGQPCGGPPSTSPRLVEGTLWRSRAGITLEYDSARWRVESDDYEDLVLVGDDGRVWLDVEIEKDVEIERAGSATNPGTGALDLPRWLKSPRQLSLPVPHGPNIGYVGGVGKWFDALLDSPQGPRQSVTVASLSSTHDHKTVLATAVFFAPASQTFDGAQGPRQKVDSILNTVAWPSSSGNEPGAAGGVSPEEPSLATGAPSGGLRPVDVVRAYDIEPLWRRGIRGGGETIALVSLDTFRDEEVAAYERLTGIEGAVPVEHIPVLGPVPLGTGSLEVHLDIDVIRAIAPKATILNYEAPLSWDGFVAALKAINDDGRASIVSVSWGKCLLHVDAPVRMAIERELARAAQAGTTVFVASGDSGAFSCLHSESELDPDQHVESVDWPAASSNVVAVGGTRLSVRDDGSYYSENAWEDTLSSDGTGGGVSPLDVRPAWQQADGDLSTGRRQLPDVAGPADCDSAYFIVYPAFTEQGWAQRHGPYGCGTSAAAPFWAAVTALVQHYARRNGVGRLGFLAPTLYELSRAKGGFRPFHDVQTGGNLKSEATRGWDFATGLGSPDAWNLARAIVAHLRQR